MLAPLEQESPEAAVSLLGALVRTTIDGATVTIRLNEVEAYRGHDDPASHAHRGRTQRNQPMFGPAGTIYIYLSYGIHWCMNIVTGKEGDPQGVLLRGGTVVDGTSVAEERRDRRNHLADGPGKLGQALGINGDLSGATLNKGPVGLSGLDTIQSAY
ncbi:MAG: DNA-3-methyladenine glycosylase, partial [Actinomycetia bacterium]|nr:DNA-3-methyladenine glycosylase [Actinomycetes bacterium]